MHKQTEGRIVHYTAYNGRCLAGMIVGVDSDGSCDLVVFTNMRNVNGDKNFGVQFHSRILRAERLPDEPTWKPGTFHWPTDEHPQDDD